MRHMLTFGIGTLLIAAFVTAGISRAADEKPKYTIKEVMKAHKAGDLKKVLDGKANKEEKEKLVAMYEAMHAVKPPKGDEEHWKKKTESMVKAAKDVVADKAGAIEELKKATNCGECHKAHKP